MKSNEIGQSEIDKSDASFVDPALESRFQTSNLDDGLSLLRIGAIVVGIAALLFGVVDYKMLGPGELFRNLIVLRATLVVISAGVFFYALRPQDLEGLRKVATLYVVAVVLAIPALEYLRPAALPTTLPIVVFLTLGIYLLFPGDFRRVCFLGILAGVALTAETAISKGPLVADTLLVFAVALLANVFGMATSYRIRMAERRRYRALVAQQAALERLRETARAQAMFVAMLSHDLRNYLNGIVGTSQIMLGADDDSTWRRQARTVAETSRNLMRLLDDALDMLRARQADLKVETGEFDLGRTVANVTGPLRARAEAKGLRFDVKVSPMLPESIQGDEFRIVQILGNLTSNAIQFTLRGQVGIEVSPVGDDDPPSRIRFVVSDSSPALSPEDVAGLFSPEVHLDGSTRVARASGLGLYIAKVLIDRLGGTIAVTGEPGGGNRFVVELDFAAQPGPVRAAAAPLPSDEGSARALTVLSVDDSPVNLEIIEVSLRRLGHIVVSARDGESALRVARAQSFDIALVDLRMPGMSGEELSAALRSDASVRARGPVPLIVAVTAETFVDLKPGEAPKGFDGLLTKPIDLVALSRYLGIARGRSAGSGDKTRSAAAIDWERLSELKRDLDRGGLDRVMTTGRAFVEQSVARLERAISESKKDDILSIAHALKGAAANIGLASVARGAIEIETLAKTGEFDRSRSILTDLRSETPSVLSAVDAWMGRQAQPDRP